MKQFSHLMFSLLFAASCNGPDTGHSPAAGAGTADVYPAGPTHGDTPWVDTTVLPYDRVQVSQYIRRMFQDTNGVIWFGTSGGVSRYDGTNFSTFTVKDGLGSNGVWSILRDTRGALWVGTEGGVSRYDGHAFTGFPIPAAAPGEYPTAARSPVLVWSILEDERGHLWFGTNGGGVHRYDGTALTTLTEKDGLSSNFVFSMLEDRTGHLWFGTAAGVSRYDGRNFATSAGQEELGSLRVWTMIEDRTGDLWLGTAGGGLWRCEAASLAHCSREEGLASNHVQSLLEDRSGILWIGTSGGVYRYDGRSFSNFTRAATG